MRLCLPLDPATPDPLFDLPQCDVFPHVKDELVDQIRREGETSAGSRKAVTLDINEVALIAPWSEEMAETKSSKPNDEVPNAQELRMRMLEREMAEIKKDEELRRRKLKERDDFVHNFLTKHVTDDERATILRLVQVAAENGKTEALVYSFPSDLCSDGGRAINSAQPDWPDTLQGKARELYERYVEIAKPKGYRLKAMIINFPGGIPGDVGFYLDWK